MTFNVIHREKQPCYCTKPTTGNWNRGDIIQCKECKEYWHCKGLSDGGMQWDPSPRVLLWEKAKPIYGFRGDIEGWE